MSLRLKGFDTYRVVLSKHQEFAVHVQSTGSNPAINQALALYPDHTVISVDLYNHWSTGEYNRK